MEFYQFYNKKKERSDALILGILGNLDPFRHLFSMLKASYW